MTQGAGNNTSEAARHQFYFRHGEDPKSWFHCVEGKNVSHKYPMHFHRSFCIGMVTKGYRQMQWGGRSMRINEGELFVVNEKEPHAIAATTIPHDYITLTVKGVFQDVFFPNKIQSEDCAGRLAGLFHSVQENRLASISDCWDRLRCCLMEQGAIARPMAPERQAVSKALMFIERNYQQAISVEDVAHEACLSTYHFCRLFSQEIGIAPHAYLLQYRLKKACVYLQDGYPVFDTAIAVGFYDSSHFIRTFFSHTGVSPKDYQASIIES